MTRDDGLDPEQRVCLAELGKKRAKYERQMHAAATTRRELNELIVVARTLGISTYKIAEKVGMSQPRVMQILGEARHVVTSTPNGDG